MQTFFGLKEKRVLITGAADGIGRIVARAFQSNGARVHVCDVSAEKIQKLKVTDPGISATVSDVSSEKSIKSLFAHLQGAHGGLDVLVNNVGIHGPVAAIENIELSDWQRTMDCNLTGFFLCMREAIPMLKKAGGGSIVNMSSTSGFKPSLLRTPYVVTKGAVIMLTKNAAAELGPHKVRVNAIAPGFTEGERHEHNIVSKAEKLGITPEAVRSAFLEQVSMRTFVEPEDLANTILFLSSDAGAKISGQVLCVDGYIV